MANFRFAQHDYFSNTSCYVCGEYPICTNITRNTPCKCTPDSTGIKIDNCDEYGNGTVLVVVVILILLYLYYEWWKANRAGSLPAPQDFSSQTRRLTGTLPFLPSYNPVERLPETLPFARSYSRLGREAESFPLTRSYYSVGSLPETIIPAPVILSADMPPSYEDAVTNNSLPDYATAMAIYSAKTSYGSL